MTPRTAGLARLVALLAVMLAAISGGVASRAVAGRPNVVVIMTDDQTLEMMRVMPRTRALIGDAGATFTDAVVSYPLCCPSRATFLTGTYAHNHGVLENEPPTGGYSRLDHSNTLPVWLQASGYHTIHVGKYLNEYGVNDPREIPAGYDEWYGLVDPTTYGMWGYTMNENGTLHTYGAVDDEDPALYQTDVLRDHAVDAITRATSGDAPFYMNLWFLAPHREVSSLAQQFPPRSAPRHRGAFAAEAMPRPASFNEADVTDKPAYMQVKPVLDDAMIADIETRYRAELETLLAVDEAVEAVVDALEDTGALANTYVLFTSDNGFFHGEHRTPVEKLLPYEPSVRVPLLMRGPTIEPGTVAGELTGNVDTAPTIVEWTGAHAGLTMDGRSLAPSLADPGARSTRPILLEMFWPVGSTLRFFTEQVSGGGGGGGGGGAPQAPLSQIIFPYQALHTGRYVYIEYPSGERELYDLAVDPDQLASAHLDPRYARPLATLALHLQLLRLCSGDLCRLETGPIPEPG